MRAIEVESGLTLRFPKRGPEFADGVEIGVLAALMALEQPVVSRTIATGNIEQARVLAENLGYRLVNTQLEGQTARITLNKRGVRPTLRVVTSA